MSLSRWLSITSKNTCVSRGPDILVIHISSASHFARAASVHSALLDPQGGLSLLMNMHGKNWFCGRQDGCPNQKDTAYPLLIGFAPAGVCSGTSNDPASAFTPEKNGGSKQFCPPKPARAFGICRIEDHNLIPLTLSKSDVKHPHRWNDIEIN
ncbi:LOW QUALITY PROTEIN: hypothetical protein CVT25_005792 [Psilocybe cyanescens]|uniref:Uncharacterized protein n=1 Tax=Psilocybe cyanescens TaxID=93625 RepID=A0A409VLQ4_PSICY|nr:LOW QUALITY PROTEIN: hypothetical protein CVT25_005792 [Psilocybe cyanescens]